MSWDKENFLKDLKTFNRILSSHDIKIIRGSLHELESYLESNLHYIKSISHVLKDIEIIVDEKIASTIPNDVESFNIFLDVNFVLDERKTPENQEDPFHNDKVNYKNHEGIDSYSIQIIIEGHSLEGVYSNTWHHDRHIFGENPGKVDHPFYHFQNGGNRVFDRIKDSGQILFLAAPRIPHPPMDLFLAFHFIVNNFCNRKSMRNIDKLLLDDDYQIIIENAQARMWTPYFKAYSNENDHKDYSFKNIFPLYIN